MSKTLCDLKKRLKGDLAIYAQLVNRPTHLCKKCGHVANEKKLLCKPLEIMAILGDAV